MIRALIRFRRLWLIPVVLLFPAVAAVAGGTKEPASTPTTLRVAVLQIAHLDPALVSSDSEIMIDNSIYDYLIDVTPTTPSSGGLPSRGKQATTTPYTLSPFVQE